MSWREKYRRDPDLAESIITTLKTDLDEAEARIEKLEIALRKIVICDWPGPYPQPIIRNRAEWMQDIAKEALK